MDKLVELSRLIRQWNKIESKIFDLIGRAGLVSHIGEFIAERVFGLELEESKTNKGFDSGTPHSEHSIHSSTSHNSRAKILHESIAQLRQ